MLGNYNTLEQHQQLLHEKGFLAPHFIGVTEVGYWLLRFQQQFEQTVQQALLEQQPERFMVELWGKFNNYLDKVHYTLRYKYDPDSERLSLMSLRAALGKHAKAYYFSDHHELPTPESIYDLLAVPEMLKNHRPLFKRLQREFEQDRNPLNDYKVPSPSDIEPEKKHWLDLTDFPPNQLRLRPKR